MMSKTPITVAYGDGIGPEIMEATLKILNAAGAQIEPETIEIGEKVYLSGNSAGIADSAWESLRRTKVFLKAPITTPQGGGFKSLNVTTRKTLGLFANVRPCVSYYPYINTKHENINTVIVRENEEDLYAGIEHRQTDQVYQCLKLITRPGSERIVRYAFEYAKANNRKKVTCLVKDNIMKVTDGLFHNVFKEIAKEYPDIESESYIIDIGSARLATRPEIFDVVVTENLYGDIISDIAAELTGSVGLCGSANIGAEVSMFEAIHGSAPDISGKGIANPSGLLHGAIMMLVHIGQPEVAEKVHNAWLKTIEDGEHTADIYKEGGLSKNKLSTMEFADAVIARLGQQPGQKLAPVTYPKGADAPKAIKVEVSNPERQVKKLEGVDIFIDWVGEPNTIGQKLEALAEGIAKLVVISNRGVKVYPNGMPETFCTDHWRCRFEFINPGSSSVVELMTAVGKEFDVIKTENLYNFDGQRGYSLAQGQ